MRKIACWTEEYTSQESIDILRTLALTHAEAAGAVGSRVVELIKKDKLRDLVEFEFDYPEAREGVDPEAWYHLRQAVALFSKLEFLEIGFDKEKAAIDSFNAAEDLCAETRLIYGMRSRGGFSFLPGVESQLHAAMRKIATVLGPFPTFEKLGYRFGKGATTLTKKRMASVREKFAAGVSCSAELVPAAIPLLRELPALCSAWATAQMEAEDESWYSVPLVVHEGKLEFVPKNAKTHRAIVTEPVLNGLYQLALGDYMVDLLKAAGVDLRDQTRNQSLARQGSISGDLATLDLKSASDCIAVELVYDLLPLEWAAGLSRARTGNIRWRGQSVKLEKFSSMGNGFTFPLESLIFWALARAVCSEDETVSVYGDDIILPSHRFNDLVRLLTAVGFIPNVKKSFYRGTFRESCGADFLCGVNIRPYYQKDLVSPRSLFVLHNFYVRRGYAAMASWLRATYIHPALQIFGPDGYGDGHLLGDWPRKRPPRFEKNGWSGYLFDTFSIKARKDTRPEMPSDFVLPSYSVYRRGPEPAVKLSPPDRALPPERLAQRLALERRFRESKGSWDVTLPLPSVKTEEGGIVSAPSFPLSDEDGGYKRLTIYTLRG